LRDHLLVISYINQIFSPPQAPSRRIGASGKMIHVVIADDDDIVRYLVEQIVSILGWTFDSAANGMQALRLIEQSVPALVISDVPMPGMNGIELLRAIKNNPRLSHIPVVLMSSGDMELEAREAWCWAFVAKPFSVDWLLQILPQAVREASSG
jgi:chemosensory pili system protein ChpA (sensor histidine kinase/response regulator)